MQKVLYRLEVSQFFGWFPISVYWLPVDSLWQFTILPSMGLFLCCWYLLHLIRRVPEFLRCCLFVNLALIGSS
ncbi:hypothetical protein L2E82_35596 [Cichorium intybus]|uniref:Uncharacterized protein n=1 Tax=Cichorium intybus TaxID=13427 RepID=A0ACB9BPD0_CICIN|nr:hypothetical protein L2E82_35596 [Cichorium intybus]